MADEIYINQGTQIQQPYQGQIAYQAFETTQRTTQLGVNRQGQQPFPFISQSPFTYRNPVNQQQPNIRDGQNPFTYTRQGQTPFTYDHQSPFTYTSSNVAKQSSYIANAQQPYPYIANVQEPNIRNAQTTIQNVSKQSPFTYDYQSPGTTPVNGQQPVIRNKQNTYNINAQGQRPIAQAGFPGPNNVQTPFTYQHLQPRMGGYQTVPQAYPGRFYDDDSPGFATYQYQVPIIAQARQPSQFQGVPVQTPTPAIANAQQPYPYIGQAQHLTFYFSPNTGEDYPYRTPTQAQAQGRTPFTLSLIHISEPTRPERIAYAVFWV